MIIQVIPSEFFPELIYLALIIDQHVLCPCHGSKVSQVLRGKGLAEARMVGASGVNPCSRSCLQIRIRLPQNACHRQFRHGRTFDNLHSIDYESEPVTHFDHRGNNSLACTCFEYQSCRVSFTTYSERMYFECRFAGSDGGTYFEHVSAERCHILRIKMIRIVFHERCAAFEPFSHHLHCCLLYTSDAADE